MRRGSSSERDGARPGDVCASRPGEGEGLVVVEADGQQIPCSDAAPAHPPPPSPRTRYFSPSNSTYWITEIRYRELTNKEQIERGEMRGDQTGRCGGARRRRGPGLVIGEGRGR